MILIILGGIVISEIIRETFTTKEAAIYLNISLDTLRKWVRKEGLPAIVIGRIWIFKKEKIDEWLERRIEVCYTKQSSHPKIINGIRIQESLSVRKYG